MKTRKVGEFSIITEELDGPPKRTRPSKFQPVADALLERGKNKPLRIAIPDGETQRNYYNRLYQGLRLCLPPKQKFRAACTPTECLFWLI